MHPLDQIIPFELFDQEIARLSGFVNGGAKPGHWGGVKAGQWGFGAGHSRSALSMAPQRASGLLDLAE
ncbi:hypothetical protein [Nitrobacter sp. 62-23]|uniref:hypothetical protein n=1 Tax=Nitrobacter sp. 62-23 TaxID=1895798 RepID=UPI0025FEEC08|nr:hypothetical protein [Nitrobacter sp. 62-23]